MAEGVRALPRDNLTGRCPHPLLREPQISLCTGRGSAERKEVGRAKGNKRVNFLASPGATGNILVDMAQKLSLS